MIETTANKRSSVVIGKLVIASDEEFHSETDRDDNYQSIKDTPRRYTRISFKIIAHQLMPLGC